MPALLSAEKKTEVYQPSEDERKIISNIWSQWTKAKEQRDASYRYFNDRSFVEYVNDSVDRFNGYIEPRTDPASDWGAKVFNNVTRNKSIAIIANITAERVRSEFFPQNQEDETDYRAAQIIKHLEDFTYYKNKDDEQQFFAVLEATTKGTAIGYEGYKKDQREVKEITDYDPTTGEVKWKKKTLTDWDDVYGEVIPLFDFYPGNIWLKDMQRQPFVIWRTVVDLDAFQSEFGKYRNASKVVDAQTYLQMVQDEKAKQDSAGSVDGTTVTFVTDGVRDQQVEVIRYFNKWTDEFHIIANGVLLTKTVSPLPWDHKMYPFWKTIFEPFATDFFYGKSLADKMRSNQDVLNTLYRMMLDQSFLSINPPIMTTGVESIRDEGLYPGKRIIVDDMNTKIMEIPGPQPAHFNIIKMVEEKMQQDSIQDPSATVGNRASAFEVGVAKESAQKLLALFLKTLEWGVRDKTELRVKNILQFYRLPKMSALDPDGALEYRRVIIDNTDLIDGTKGRQVIQITPSASENPPTDSITKAEAFYAMRGQNIAFSFVPIDLLKNIDLKIKIVPNSSVKMSEALNRALELDYQQKAALLYPDLMNRQEGWISFNEAFDKDPQKMTMQQAPAMAGSPLGSPTPAPFGANPAPASPSASIPGAARSGPSASSPNSATAAGVPNANTAMNSVRNAAV